ncbi:ribitol 5-phosphate transferase FKRP [Epargyreus clarus]|uniref:ribitol 5-phosphate transferase FKRP n=1 Tax=Epargyreus clarus TaxID=520877 RepID=UPI003C2F5160
MKLFNLLLGRFTVSKLVALTLTAVFMYGFCQMLHSRMRAMQQAEIHPPSTHLRPVRHLSKVTTVVFRQFEEFENDIADSVQTLVTALPNIPIVILCQSKQYPPFQFSVSNETLRNVRVVSLELKLDASPRDLNPLTHILTEYVMIVPDSIRVTRRSLQIPSNSKELKNHPIAIGVGNSRLVCQQVTWNYADWTLQYTKEAGKLCDAVSGQHALIIKTSLLQSLPQPFAFPFPEALYLQTAVKNVKIFMSDGKIGAGRSVLKTPASKQKVSRRMRDYRVALYKQLGVKAVIREDGRVQWYGCKRETQRCFPPVQGTPSYVLAGRNLPPCCRRNIRRTAAHVLRSLLQAGARCWLETTSLLGAVTQGDILPWAEYAEIGIHASDLTRVSWLQRGGADADGFVWERATKGHYYRVAYSATNRVYVLVLPFTAKNGTMWPADWVMAHQREFPERHLHPLAQIQFAGRQAPAPNDARAFLDLKLGIGAVEKCNKIGAKLLYP